MRTKRQDVVTISKLYRGRINLAAVENEAQIRRVELFQESGAAANGDLRVVEAGVPSAPKK